MSRPTDPRGANRRGSGWGDDIGYSAERTTTTPAPRYVAPEPDGVKCAPFVPQLATFSDGTQAVIVPLGDRVIGRLGDAQARRVVEIWGSYD